MAKPDKAVSHADQAQAEVGAIVLIGFMGSGKSSVARLLAHDLNREAIDLDKAVEQMTGSAVAQLFATQGEAAFRALETQALQAALQTSRIIATGGGVPTQASNRALLQQAPPGTYVVYLKAQPHTLATRIRRQPGKRPLIDGRAVLNLEQTQARVEQLLTERATHYEACAHIIVDTDNLRMIEVAQAIVTQLPKRSAAVRDGGIGD